MADNFDVVRRWARGDMIYYTATSVFSRTFAATVCVVTRSSALGPASTCTCSNVACPHDAAVTRAVEADVVADACDETVVRHTPKMYSIVVDNELRVVRRRKNGWWQCLLTQCSCSPTNPCKFASQIPREDVGDSDEGSKSPHLSFSRETGDFVYNKSVSNYKPTLLRDIDIDGRKEAALRMILRSMESGTCMLPVKEGALAPLAEDEEIASATVFSYDGSFLCQYVRHRTSLRLTRGQDEHCRLWFVKPTVAVSLDLVAKVTRHFVDAGGNFTTFVKTVDAFPHLKAFLAEYLREAFIGVWVAIGPVRRVLASGCRHLHANGDPECIIVDGTGLGPSKERLRDVP